MSETWNELRDRLPKFADAVEVSVDAGQSAGCQAYVSLRGEAVASAGCGEGRPGVAMDADSIPLWMSMGKPLTAVLCARLGVDVARPVVDFVPEFGKPDVTVAHVLTHTGGFRNVGSNWSPEPWPKIIDRVCGAKLEDDWTPGETAGYHVASGWYVLAEICRRVSGHDDPLVMYRRELLEPLGMPDCWVGMPKSQYLDYGTRLSLTYDTSKDEPKPMAFPNSESGFTLCRPGGNARGPVAQLGRFYETLLHDREHGGFLPRDAALAYTARQRRGLRDKTFGAVIDWSYGFLLADPHGERIPYGYGPHASPDAFGHSGNQSSCAFADPRHRLVVVWCFNGLPGEVAHQKRQQAINAAVYEDLGLAETTQ